MKKIVLTLLVSAVAFTLFAQTEAPKNRKPLVEVELAMIDSAKIMDQATFAKFEPIYRDYAAKRRTIRHDIRVAKKAMRSENISDADAKAELDKMLNGQVQIAQLAQQYADQFLTVITPQQLVRVYRVHDVLRSRLMHAHRAKKQVEQKNK